MGVLARFRPYRPARVRQLPAAVYGGLRVFVRPPGAVAGVEATFVRGAQTQVGSYGFTDPFGPDQLSMSFPAVTIFDALGHGELEWLTHSADVDIVYDGEMVAGYPYAGWRWEGYIVSFGRSSGGGLEVSCVGALRQMDNYLAKPSYPSRPIPYEVAIKEAFDQKAKPDLRVAQPVIEWPSWWTTRYEGASATTPAYMIPTGVPAGAYWTGLVTRSTGSWDPLLTSYINSLLSAMYTEHGRWTLDLDPLRRTVLRHRDFISDLGPSVVVIHPGMPGVNFNLNIDWSQALNVLYGQGQALNKVTYSGMQVNVDGSKTTYTPLAALRQVEPTSDKNGWLQQGRMRKEVMLELQQGLDLTDARKVSYAHLQRFCEPGITGTIDLESDPTMGDLNGPHVPRHFIRAGMTVWVPHLFGNPDGHFLHVTASSGDFTSGKVTLTVDSKHRDSLTVDEVRLRGRDALAITRGLMAGQYSPVVPDQVLPWVYEEGSGYIPSGEQYNSLRLFAGMPDDVQFPWTEWTTKRPPGSASWASSYIKIGPKAVSANDNWATLSDKKGGNIGIPIKVAQAGNIRLIQIAAYDKLGNVMKVPFHVGLYYQHGVSITGMPRILAGEVPVGSTYKPGERYPFAKSSFQKYNPDGTQIKPENIAVTEASTGEIKVWGDYYEKAGFFPGSYAAGDPATGLLVDETPWDFDISSQQDSQWDPYSATQGGAFTGYIYIMIYCDAQGEEPVYFTGRIFRAEPGAEGNR